MQPRGLERDVSLSKHTSARVGGPADLFTVAKNSRELEQSVLWGIGEGLDILVLGSGSNVLVSDKGFRGLVVKSIGRELTVVRDDDEGVVVELASGTFLPSAAKHMAEMGIAGLEWGVGIPGTAGGAVVGNAGAYGGETRETLIEIDAVDSTGEVVTLSSVELRYEYRSSAIKLGELDVIAVLRVRHQLHRDDPQRITERRLQFLSERKRKEPVEPTIGSTFKNPPGMYAGQLIESLGLKGMSVGRAMVSPKHANYMVNTGGASARDIRSLLEKVREAVRERTGIELETEIEFKGDWS